MVDQLHMARRAAEKADAVDDLDYIMAVIEGEGREPDAWEKDCIVEGLGHALRGNYGLVYAEVDAALTPAEERGALSPDVAAKWHGFGIARLRRVLRIVATEPAQAWQHFGPIICSDGPRP